MTQDPSEDPGAASVPTSPAFARAELLAATGRHDRALAELASHLAEWPEDVDALCLLAISRVAVGDVDEAVRAAARARVLHPLAEWPARVAAHALSASGDHEEAFAAALAAVELAPGLWQTHLQLALVGVRADRPQMAWAPACRAAQLAPDVAEAHATVGAVALRFGDSATAERAYRTALSLDPQNAEALLGLGAVQHDRGRLVDAAHAYTAVARTAPDGEALRVVRNVVWTLPVLAHVPVLALIVLLARGLHYEDRPTPAAWLQVGGVAGFVAVIVVSLIYVARLPAPVRRSARRAAASPRGLTMLLGLATSSGLAAGVGFVDLPYRDDVLSWAFLLLVGGFVYGIAVARRSAEAT